MVSYMSSASVGGTIVVHATGGGVELFRVVGVVVVTCVGVCLVVRGGGSLFFFKVGGCYEDGTTEFTDVDAAEGGVLFDVEPEIQVVDGALVVAHEDVEAIEVDGGACFGGNDFRESRQTGCCGRGHLVMMMMRWG
jgi:hypothetical protein